MLISTLKQLYSSLYLVVLIDSCFTKRLNVKKIILVQGAILIFLPGYDEIVGLRDRILFDDKRFADNAHR